MSSTAVTSPARVLGALSLPQRLVRSAVLGRLARITSGQLAIEEDGEVQVFGVPVEGAPHAHAVVLDPRFWHAVATGGSVGAGRAYAQGWWSSPDATAVVRAFVRNVDALEGFEAGLARLSRPFLGLYHALRRNTEAGSRENIHAHYDLSNEFFQLFLDPTMTYSCGIFEREDSTMEEASFAKIDALCETLELDENDHLLEIGTGWGAFAIRAASKYGCRVTTTTISEEQHAFAAERIREAGLDDRITLLLEDYRKLEGTYDKLVSVEMIEAVGHHYYGEFFRRCGELLRPGGRMALQAITIADQHFESARDSVDFIKRYIFPGSCIPSVTALLNAAKRSSELKLVGMRDIGMHYVRTLATWRDALRERAPEARALGFDDETLRLWDFYFCYCEGGFAERHISDVHLVLEGPGPATPSRPA